MSFFNLFKQNGKSWVQHKAVSGIAPEVWEYKHGFSNLWYLGDSFTLEDGRLNNLITHWADIVTISLYMSIGNESITINANIEITPLQGAKARVRIPDELTGKIISAFSLNKTVVFIVNGKHCGEYSGNKFPYHFKK